MFLSSAKLLPSPNLFYVLYFPVSDDSLLLSLKAYALLVLITCISFQIISDRGDAE